MYPIQQHIQEYIKTHSIRELQDELHVGASALYAIINGEERKYTKKMLDKLYDFFKLSQDDFYKIYCISQEYHTNILGTVFREKREAEGKNIYQVAKAIKGTERQMKRFETGKVSYIKNSYYIKALMDYYEMEEGERAIINGYLDALWGLKKMNKKKSSNRTRNPVIGNKYNISNNYGKSKTSKNSEFTLETSRGQESLSVWE